MTPPVFPLRAAAALFLERQHLDRPRGRRLTAASLGRFVETTGGLQIDSINVVERAHYLTLWSRFDRYDRRSLDRLIYRRRVLFEYLSHVACFVATSDLPAFRRVMADTPERFRTKWQPWTRKHAPTIRAVEREIAKRGPLGNADFERPDGRKASGWWDWKPAQQALDYLWKAGKIAVHSRQHFQKRYDLMDRVLPGARGTRPLTRIQHGRWTILRSLRAMGAATYDDLRAYWSYPGASSSERRGYMDALIRAGEVAEIAIEGDPRRWYARAEDLPALERAAARRSPSPGTTLLSPFDSFLWHRERTLRLFDYHYRIEVYVPGPLRKHGYYSLPILHDGRFIGRLDPKTHRDRKELEVRSVHFETWFGSDAPRSLARWGPVDADAALAGLSEAVHSLAAFVGAERVTLGRVSPERFRRPFERLLLNSGPGIG